MKKRTAILVFWFISASLLWSAEQKPRLGIVGGEDAAGLTDLLAVELSRSTDVILVERGEIQKVLRELSLSAERSASDYLKLGRLLKADGLLILEPVEIEGKKAVSARLVAVNPGVVLGIAHSPLPVPDPEAWSKLATKRFVPLLPKLTVAAKDGIPISIFNLYSSIDTPETRNLEQELSILLAHRLIRERDIFVLERWRMEQLTREKDLELEKDNPFWTGSYLLDGRIDGKTVFGSEAEINVSLRLRLPQDKGKIEIKAAGRKDDLPALVNNLAVRVMGALNKTPTKSEWDPKAEAEQYFQEAKWASAPNLSWIVQSACENAWALGCRNDELARLRISSYCRGNDLESAIRAMEWVCQNQKNQPSLLGTRLDPRHDRTDSEPSWNLRAGTSGSSTTRERSAWLGFWKGVVGHASEVLKRYQDENLSAGHEERLRDLRMLVRSAADDLASRGEKQIDGLKCMYAP